MLSALSIRNIVLINALELDFSAGLTVLTGETGAGKSILLDAFALALGTRGDAALVRQGEAQGQVTAVFELAGDHPVFALLADAAIECDGPLILRRVQNKDGRSKAFINDAPVSVQLLRQAGALLVEIHGQHDDRAFVDSGAHRQLCDAYGGHQDQLRIVSLAWSGWQAAEDQLREHEAFVKKIREDADYLSHALEELRQLGPEEGEAEKLAARRQVMMHAEKLSEDLESALQALTGARGNENKISAALRKLERQSKDVAAIIEPVSQALERVLLESNEARNAISEALRAAAYEPKELEHTEERLFALRALARKHNVSIDGLARLMERIEKELDTLNAGENKLQALREEVKQRQEHYIEQAEILSAMRQKVAAELDAAVLKELPPLKLEKAKFITHIERRDLAQAGPNGLDQVSFWVQTNPGSAAGPIMKVASGGELSRFILALKVVLAERGSAPVLIFDEIDTGAGGATAAAIGARLARLADTVQVLTITHAPQVAARAKAHMQISKSVLADSDVEHSVNGTGADDAMVTQVVRLDPALRREEIARMLAGETITQEARAAADRLISGQV